MTLQEVPTEILAESLLAVQDLRRKYQGEPQTTRYAAPSNGCSPARCPLCRFRNAHRTETEENYGCEEFCPWFWIEGHHCEEWDGDNGDLLSYDDFAIPVRLERVDKWETTINAELAKREAK